MGIYSFSEPSTGAVEGPVTITGAGFFLQKPPAGADWDPFPVMIVHFDTADGERHQRYDVPAAKDLKPLIFPSDDGETPNEDATPDDPAPFLYVDSENVEVIKPAATSEMWIFLSSLGSVGFDLSKLDSEGLAGLVGVKGNAVVHEDDKGIGKRKNRRFPKFDSLDDNGGAKNGAKKAAKKAAKPAKGGDGLSDEHKELADGLVLEVLGESDEPMNTTTLSTAVFAKLSSNGVKLPGDKRAIREYVKNSATDIEGVESDDDGNVTLA